MRDSQRKGEMATTQAIAIFTRLEFNVSLPTTESVPYELIIANGVELQKGTRSSTSAAIKCTCAGSTLTRRGTWLSLKGKTLMIGCTS